MRAEVPLPDHAQKLQVLTRQQERPEFHNRLDAESMRRQACANVLERELRLVRETGGDRPVGTHPNLPGNEDELRPWRNYRRVRIRADGCVNVSGIQKCRHLVHGISRDLPSRVLDVTRDHLRRDV